MFNSPGHDCNTFKHNQKKISPVLNLPTDDAIERGENEYVPVYNIYFQHRIEPLFEQFDGV